MDKTSEHLEAWSREFDELIDEIRKGSDEFRRDRAAIRDEFQRCTAAVTEIGAAIDRARASTAGIGDRATDDDRVLRALKREVSRYGTDRDPDRGRLFPARPALDPRCRSGGVLGSYQDMRPPEESYPFRDDR